MDIKAIFAGVKEASIVASAAVKVAAQSASSAYVAQAAANAEVKKAAAEKAEAERIAAMQAEIDAYNARKAAEAAADVAAKKAAIEADIAAWEKSIYKMSGEIARINEYSAKIVAEMEEADKKKDYEKFMKLSALSNKAYEEWEARFKARSSAFERVKALKKELDALKNI